MDWIFGILCILLLAVSIILIALLRKALSRVEFYEKWTEEFIVRLFETLGELKRIDASGHFEADDEVGYFFKSLKDLMNRLYQLGVLDEEEIKESQKEQVSQLSTEEINQILSSRRQAKTIPKEKTEV